MQYTVKAERTRAREQLTMSQVRWEGQPSVLCELSAAKTGGGVGGNAESLAPCARALAFDLERIR